MTTTWWKLNGGGVLEFDTEPPIELKLLRFQACQNASWVWIDSESGKMLHVVRVADACPNVSV